MRERHIKIPHVDVYICTRFTRRVCEHVCFSGATIDLIACALQAHMFIVEFIGKFAFVVGGVAVYLLHKEEKLHRMREAEKAAAARRDLKEARRVS